MTLRGPGALRHRVWLESLIRTDDTGGGAVKSWQQVAALWVAIRPLSGREQNDAGKLSSRISHEIILRYRPLSLPEIRFRKGARLFHVLAVYDPDERRRWLRALCEEREGEV
jgi:SPP1 family predicted phage head-tail adaptor